MTTATNTPQIPQLTDAPSRTDSTAAPRTLRPTFRPNAPERPAVGAEDILQDWVPSYYIDWKPL